MADRDAPLGQDQLDVPQAQAEHVVHHGGDLRSQTDGRQATEVAIAAAVLNRMLDLGRPEYVRIA